jgi:hypothetical protein
MPYDVPQLLQMSQPELDALFSAHQAGPIPDGRTDGTVIAAPGTAFSLGIATFIKYFLWKGKIFDAKAGILTNRLGPLGSTDIVAKVYKAPSWLDGNECIVLDYSQTSIFARCIRDEIRLIEPSGFYLGKVFLDKARILDFALHSQAQPRPASGRNHRHETPATDGIS